MIRIPFVDSWYVASEAESATVARRGPLTLPYDAMLREKRDPAVPSGHTTGFFPGGVYRYTKTFDAPGEWRTSSVTLEFEGVFHRSQVFVNGHRAGGRPSGYALFHVELDDLLEYGADNLLEVVVDTSDQPNSRWYSGSGIYRPVHLLVGGPVRISPMGLKVWTTAVEGADAEVVVSVEVVNSADRPRTVTVAVTVAGVSRQVEVRLEPGTTQAVRQTLTIPDASLWSPDTPTLHSVEAVVRDADAVLDAARDVTGLRVISVDVHHGLRINGTAYKLRGACIHHDNGVIGANEFDAAADRRIRILKESGYNAIRSAHNPVSRALLNACDRHGMMVMDEFTDVWYRTKATFDYALDFATWWERDLEAMIANGVNHPSVVMWSIGNEIAETGQPKGVALASRIADRVRELDPTRPVTNCVNPFLNLIAPSDAKKDTQERKARRAGEEPGKNLIAVLNFAMGALNMIVPHLLRLRAVDKRTEQAFAAVNVAGYNYAAVRYRMDARRHPERVIVGSESNPPDLASHWRLIEQLPHVIGDFAWTGWDYIGEAGIAVKRYNGRRRLFLPYPALLAGEPVIDILGHRQTQSHLNQIAWGQTHGPHLAVQPVDHAGEKQSPTSWRSTNSIASWAWDGHEGRNATVEVYADAHRIELLLNGERVGSRILRSEDCYAATFTVPYTPGELTAIAYAADGTEIGRDTLRSAESELRLALAPETDRLRADGADLVYVPISLTDQHGVVRPLADREVTVSLEGPGTLLGFGSAEPITTEGFTDTTHTTFQGRALAVIRAGYDTGRISLTAVAEGCAPQTVHIPVVDANDLSNIQPPLTHSLPRPSPDQRSAGTR